MATRVKRTSTNGLERGSQGAPNDAITPEEIASIRNSAVGPEQAPSTRQQTGATVNWREVFNRLGNPFERRRVPLSIMQEMEVDPIVGFGLAFTRMPIARANWRIRAKGDGAIPAQVAAHVEEDLRVIYPSLVLQILQMLPYGFQAISKRFVPQTPKGTFIDSADSGDKTEKPIWSEGGIQPIGWKHSVPLMPETVNPIFDDSTGEFAGIDWKPSEEDQGPIPKTGMKKTAEGSYEIDVYHSLWATTERETVGGNIFGRSRLVYVYPYWFSYWFRWAIADRAFERKGDPTVVVRHPEKDIIDEARNERIPAREWAMTMGERLRAGSVVSLPSGVVLGYEDKPTNIREWDIEFIKGGFEFDPFDSSFEYLDIAKLRALWIPEQALVEGRGGTSSRNVAEVFGDAFTAQQSVLLGVVDEIINRWMIPQHVIVNYPEFVGKVWKETDGIASEDLEFQKQIIQLVGQQDEGAAALRTMIEMRDTLEQAGMALVPVEEQKRREEEELKKLAAAGASPVTPIPGGPSGVVRVPNAGSVTGFSSVHVEPRQLIQLSDASADFIAELPSTPHYEDRSVRALARRLWSSWNQLYRSEFRSFSDFLKSLDTIELSDNEIDLSISDGARARATAIVRKWEGDLDKLGSTIDETHDSLKRVLQRSAAIIKRKARFDETPSDDELESWAQERVASLATRVTATTRDELISHLAHMIDEGVEDPVDLAASVDEKFNDHPNWKSARLVRSEVRDAYNIGELLTGRANGMEIAQAIDGEGEHPDAECALRDGQLFSIEQALREEDHPNGTLHWRFPVAAPKLKAEFSSNLAEGVVADYDKDRQAILFREGTDKGQQRKYLKAIGEALSNG